MLLNEDGCWFVIIPLVVEELESPLGRVWKAQMGVRVSDMQT